MELCDKPICLHLHLIITLVCVCDYVCVCLCMFEYRFSVIKLMLHPPRVGGAGSLHSSVGYALMLKCRYAFYAKLKPRDKAGRAALSFIDGSHVERFIWSFAF